MIKVFGYDDLCRDFDYTFKSLFRAARAFIKLDKQGMNVVFIDGVSPEQERRIQDLLWKY